jgi:hypothetical protein
MATRVLALVAGSLLAVGVVGATAPPVQAEFCRPVMPDHARDAKGYTFEAEVASIRNEGDNPPLTYIAMAVSKVYANYDSERLAEGRTIELFSNPCDGFGLLGLDEGDEILMSTAYLEVGDGPATWNTAVWRRDGRGLGLLVLHGDGFEKVWYTSDRRIEGAKTTRQALALVAPAAIGTPATDTEPIDAVPAPQLPVLFASLVAGLVGLLVAVRRLGV